jgi:hypothetical protein
LHGKQVELFMNKGNAESVLLADVAFHEIMRFFALVSQVSGPVGEA